MNEKVAHDLLLQSLEHERGGVKIYQAAIECAINEDLQEEWTRYLAETRRHVEIMESVCRSLGLDPAMRTPGCEVVAGLGAALLASIRLAQKSGSPESAQIVATECVTLAETKDHLDWELMGMLAKKLPADQRKALLDAYEEVEDQEDEHLYHTRGWCRELWIEALGMPAQLPPPEERKHVKTAIGAARAEHSRRPSGRRPS